MISSRTVLNKLDKRISSILPFLMTLLMDSVKRKEHSLVHLPEKAVTLVFEAKRTLLKIVMDCVSHWKNNGCPLLCRFYFSHPPNAAQPQNREEQSLPQPPLCTHRCTNPPICRSNVSYTILLPTWDYYFTNESYLPSKNSTLFLYILFLYRVISHLLYLPCLPPWNPLIPYMISLNISALPSLASFLKEFYTSTQRVTFASGPGNMILLRLHHLWTSFPQAIWASLSWASSSFS